MKINNKKMDVNTSNSLPDNSIIEFELTENNINDFRRRVISVTDILEQFNSITLENTHNIPDPNSVILDELK